MKDTLKDNLEYYRANSKNVDVRIPKRISILDVDDLMEIILDELKYNSHNNYYYILDAIIDKLKIDDYSSVIIKLGEKLQENELTLPYWEELSNSEYLYNIVIDNCQESLVILLNNIFKNFNDKNIELLLQLKNIEYIFDYMTSNEDNIPLYEYIINIDFNYNMRYKYYFNIILNEDVKHLTLYINHFKKMILENNLLEDFMEFRPGIVDNTGYTTESFYKDLDVSEDYKLGVII